MVDSAHLEVEGYMPGRYPPPPTRGVLKSKVFWTDLEKARIVKRAVDLRESQPGLAGLALLREAVEVLPPHRRRDLIALSQAAWFSRMVADESKRREMEVRLKDDTVTVLRENRGHHETWMTEQLSRFDRLLTTMEKVLTVSEDNRCANQKVADRSAAWQQQVLERLTTTVEIFKSQEQVQKETTAEIAADHRQMVDLLSQLCAEMRNLSSRLSAGGSNGESTAKRR